MRPRHLEPSRSPTKRIPHRHPPGTIPAERRSAPDLPEENNQKSHVSTKGVSGTHTHRTPSCTYADEAIKISTLLDLVHVASTVPKISVQPHCSPIIMAISRPPRLPPCVHRYNGYSGTDNSARRRRTSNDVLKIWIL